jgi:hypothetical protein
MDIESAYREVETFRGAAEICSDDAQDRETSGAGRKPHECGSRDTAQATTKSAIPGEHSPRMLQSPF